MQLRRDLPPSGRHQPARRFLFGREHTHSLELRSPHDQAPQANLAGSVDHHLYRVPQQSHVGWESVTGRTALSFGWFPIFRGVPPRSEEAELTIRRVQGPVQADAHRAIPHITNQAIPLHQGDQQGSRDLLAETELPTRPQDLRLAPPAKSFRLHTPSTTYQRLGK